jgi:hypothetical protein
MSQRLRIGLSLLIALAGLAVGTGVATAGNGFAMAVNVDNTRETIVGSSNGTCTWQVTSDVTLVNLTAQDLTISAVNNAVSWSAPDDTSGVVTDVRILNSNGLEPGTTVAANQSREFSNYVVEFSIPCKADNGDLAIKVTTQRGTSSGDASFLDNGTPVPLTSVGIVGLTAALALVLMFVQRRRHRHNVEVTA